MEKNRKMAELAAIRQRIKPFSSLITTSGYSAFAVAADGRVLLPHYREMDGRHQVSSWHRMAAVAAGELHTVGLHMDGTVSAAWRDDMDRRHIRVGSWRDIVALDAEAFHTVGLRSDGTVVATGPNRYGECELSSFQNIVDIAVAKSLTFSGEQGLAAHVLGLRADGTVVAAGKNSVGECEVSHWRDIVEVDTSRNCSVGLRADGTVVLTHVNTFEEWDRQIAEWRDIVSVRVAWGIVVGLRADGTVVTTSRSVGPLPWRDVIAIAAGNKESMTLHVYALHRDGTVSVAASGDPRFTNRNGESNVEHWKLFETADTFFDERIAALQKYRSHALLLPASRKKNIDARIAELEMMRDEIQA